MQNFILTRVLRFVGRKMDGKKTYFAGTSAILIGVAGLFRVMFPEAIQAPDLTLEQSLGSIISGLAMLGIGGKLEKTKKAIERKGTQDEQEDEEEA